MNLANKITILRIILIPLFIVLLSIPIKHNTLIAAIVFTAAACTDSLDGYVARKEMRLLTLENLSIRWQINY